MSDLFLGIIAAAVAIMASIQVLGIVFAMKAARRVEDAVTRFETDVRPIVMNLRSMSADAARTANVASAQAQRAEQLIADVTARVNDTVAAVVAPAREAFAVIRGVMAAFASFRQGPVSPQRHPAASDEEDSLFIG